MAVIALSSAGPGVSRRRFLGRAVTVAAAAPLVLTRPGRGAEAPAPPSRRVGVGIIGLGGRGMDHLNGFMHAGDVQIVGVCDPYGRKRDAAKAHVERFYADRAGQDSYRGCLTTADFRELVARDDIDAVAIASPEFWHGLQSIAAVSHGKDVYCEKALTLTVAEGRAVCEAVRRHGRVLQVGTQQRSSRNFRFACELARNGYLGKVHTVEVAAPGGRALPDAPVAPVPPDLDYQMWLGPAPDSPYNEVKCSYNWYFIYDYCIGWVQSWGVHHMDIALWGAPALATSTLEVEGTATFPEQGLANTSISWQVTARTADGVTLRFADDAHQRHGCRFVGDRGSVLVDRSGIWAEPASLLGVTLRPEDEHLYDSKNHLDDFLQCLRTRRDPVSPVESGHAATTLTIVADIATRTGRKLVWDWRQERFVNDDGANRFLRRPMRSPWHV